MIRIDGTRGLGRYVAALVIFGACLAIAAVGVGMGAVQLDLGLRWKPLATLAIVCAIVLCARVRRMIREG